MAERSLFAHAGSYFSAAVATRALGFISLPIYTRLLTPSEYGLVNVFWTWVPIFAVLLSANSFSAVSRYWFEEQDDFGGFLLTTLAITGTCLAVFSVLAVTFSNRLSGLLGLPRPLMWLLLPFVAAFIIESLFLQVFMPQKKSRLIGTATTLRAYAGFAGGVAGVLLARGNPSFALLAGQFLGGILFVGVMVHFLVPFVRRSATRAHVRYLFSYSLPLIPYTLSGTILAQFDRVMINSISGSADAGLYSVAYNIGMLLSLLVSALVMAFTPDYFEYMNTGRYRKLDEDVRKMVWTVFGGAAFLTLFGSEVGLMLAGEKFHAALGIVDVVVFGYAGYALWFIYGRNIGFVKKVVYSPIIAGIGGGLNIGLNWLFIPHYGYMASAWTTVASYLAMATMGYVVSRWFLRVHTTSLSVVLPPLVALLALAALSRVVGAAGMGLAPALAVKTVLFATCVGLVFRCSGIPFFRS
ncbi:MAG: oligosaccharide flippase family protein [Proteobacteria bacterium]|nr:oligosaccharide flippase family protein [Pseudomonadota bacterium]